VPTLAKAATICKNCAFLLPVLTMLMICAVFPASDGRAADDFPPTYVQAFIGAAEFDEEQMTFAKTSSDDPDSATANDLSSMPFLGFGGQYAFSEGNSHFGLDGTILLGWRSRDSSVSAGNGQAEVKLDTDLWLIDLAMGVYAQTIFGDHWRVYVAAGPLMLFGEYTEEAEEEDPEVTTTEESEHSSSDSGFGIGGYARAGLEYRLANHAFMGLCVRAIDTNLEFAGALDDSGLNGVQGFLTYSQPFR
jgi:hypothetical protein